jgi:hypothetical protein
MQTGLTTDLRYPIGKFAPPESISDNDIAGWISDIETFPGLLNNEADKLNAFLHETTYRDGGWNARQLIHHLADSHMNAFIRFRLTLTEETPVIKPYMEDRWAELADSRTMDPEISLSIINGIHARWIVMLRSLETSMFERKYFHPESKKEFTLKTALALYSWHGRHHLEHLKIIISKKPL